MKRTVLPFFAFFGALALHVAQALYYYPRLPARVASHFNASGAPDSWAPKQFFVAMAVGVALVMAVALLASAYGMRLKPVDQIKLPNKDYWLAPERRGETFDWLTGHFLLFGAGTLLLLAEVFGQVFRMNMGLTRKLDHPLTSLMIYASFTMIWVAALLRRFSRPR